LFDGSSASRVRSDVFSVFPVGAGMIPHHHCQHHQHRHATRVGRGWTVEKGNGDGPGDTTGSAGYHCIANPNRTWRWKDDHNRRLETRTNETSTMDRSRRVIHTSA